MKNWITYITRDLKLNKVLQSGIKKLLAVLGEWMEGDIEDRRMGEVERHNFGLIHVKTVKA